MAGAAVTVFGGDLMTGEITVRKIPVSTAKVVENLRCGTLTATAGLPMKDALTDVVTELASLLLPGRSFLGYDFNGTIIECGPIWSDSFEMDSGNHTLKAAGLMSIFDYQLVLPLLDEGQLPRDVASSWTGLSLRTIAKRLVQQAVEWNPSLPIVFEADLAGANERNYPGLDTMRTRDALENLTNVIGGPDAVLRPEYKDPSHVQWRLLTGDPLLSQSGAHHVWNAAVPGSSVRGTKIERDATVLTSFNVQTGAEAEDDETLQAIAYDDTLPEAGYPLLMSTENRSSVTELPTLQGHADNAVEVGREQLETWSFQARRSPVDDAGNHAGPWLGEYRAGDFARVEMPDNPRVATGGHEVRVMEISADLGDWVTVKFAPKRTVVA